MLSDQFLKPTMPLFSILDLAFVSTGHTPADALRHSTDLAQHAERWGYHRFWLAQHHNLTGIASAATAVVIGYIAGATRTIRVGAGGIMLPNHVPLVQQFTNLFRSTPGQLHAPIDDIETYWTPQEKAQASAMLTYSFVGSRQTVRHGLQQFIEQTCVDEVIVVSAIYDHRGGFTRMKSLQTSCLPGIKQCIRPTRPLVAHESRRYTCARQSAACAWPELLAH